MTKWLSDTDYNDVVVSTRIRVARNLRDHPFPIYADQQEARKVLEIVRDAIDSSFEEGSFRHFEMSSLESRERMRLMEEHLISPVLVEQSEKSGFSVRDDEKVTIMVNEEDHIRLQTLLPGLALAEGWGLCSQVDDALEDKLDYAFDGEYGYLTACPTNTGTGLRASVMLHMPAVSITGHIGGIIDALKKIGLTIRGIYGEGTEAVGHLYQVSNQLTLGETEEEILEKLERVVHQLIRRERNTRLFLLDKKNLELQDRVYRALGALRYARTISSREAMELISVIKLGCDVSLLEDYNGSDLIREMIEIKAGSIQSGYGRAMSQAERDMLRAELLREYFN
ncbi:MULTISPECIES: protein arginine kinase [Gudongella]|uniref:protein arginine kinase n=1 Tax=Gudongella oleilytica TaxID=1582259 RepID=UPI002A36C718|nr:protein arginine kinase [Gudongella oleilytica]MDY0256633.1 protein arginine kinase [Gudongella oleilytica]